MPNYISDISLKFLKHTSYMIKNNMFEDISNFHILKEHMTLKIDSGRRAGHSTAARELSELIENSLVINPSYALNKMSNAKNKICVNPGKELDLLGYSGNLNLVIVDESKAYTTDGIDNLMHVFSHLVRNKNEVRNFAMLFYA